MSYLYNGNLYNMENVFYVETVPKTLYLDSACVIAYDVPNINVWQLQHNFCQ